MCVQIEFQLVFYEDPNVRRNLRLKVESIRSGLMLYLESRRDYQDLGILMLCPRTKSHRVLESSVSPLSGKLALGGARIM